MAPGRTAAYAILLPATMVPLAAALVGRIDGEQDRRVVLAAVAVCAVGAVVAGVARELSPVWGDLAWQPGVAWGPSLLTAGITVVPGVVAAGPAMPGAEPLASGRVLRSTELAIAAVTPAVALLVAPTPVSWAFLLWVGAVAAAGRFAVHPSPGSPAALSSSGT